MWSAGITGVPGMGEEAAFLNHVALADLRTHRPTLEDVFVTLTGKHLRDE